MLYFFHFNLNLIPIKMTIKQIAKLENIDLKQASIKRNKIITADRQIRALNTTFDLKLKVYYRTYEVLKFSDNSISYKFAFINS